MTSARQKLPQELDLKELLEIVKDAPNVKNEKVDFNDPILSFAQAFNLRPGTRIVSDKLLYNLFKIWYPEALFDKRNFNTQLNNFIPSKMIGTRRYFTIDKNYIKISKYIQEGIQKKSQDVTKSKHFHNQFTRFLEDNDLKEGTVFIESDILYYIYNNWCDGKNNKPIQYNAFLAICDLYFEPKRLMDNVLYFYGLNNSIKKLITTEKVNDWRQGRIKYGKHKAEGYKIYERARKQVLYNKKTKSKTKS